MSFIEDKPIREGLDPADLMRMNIGRRWWHCLMSNMVPGEAYTDIVKKYIEKISSHVRNGRGLLFHGEFSTGKTGCAVVVAKAAVCHGATAFFVAVPELQDHKFEKNMFDDHTSVWQRMCDVDLLVLDDLGAEHGKEWAISLVERVVRLRSNQKKVVIATTNRMNSLQDIYGESVMAILRSVTYPVLVKGKNWRAEEASDLKKEILG